jgi:tetratricopeptide (TPR) repeat protein
MATAYHGQGRFNDALTGLTEAVEHARLAGVRRTEALALVGLGDVASDLGDFDLAIETYERGLTIAREVGEGSLVGYAFASGAEALRLNRQIAEAAEWLSAARDQLSLNQSAYEAALLDYVRGTLAMDRDELTGAAEHLEDAARSFAAMGSQREEARALIYRSAVALRAGDEVGAGTWRRRAEKAMTAFGYPDAFTPYLQRLPEVFGRRSTVTAGELFIQVEAPPAAARATGDDSTPDLMARAFGMPDVTSGGVRIDQKAWQTLVARDVFFYLLDHPAGVTRDELMLVFWPDSSAVRARSALHSTLYRIRRAVGRNVVATEFER